MSRSMENELEKGDGQASDGDSGQHHETLHMLLVPQPTDDPQDPLNWVTGRKLRIFSSLCVAAYTGNASALSGQLAYPLQAEVYNRSPLELSYAVSAAISGLAAGAIFFVPFAQLIGRSSLIFWSLLGCLGCAIWSAVLTSADDYISFVMSRMLSGMFASVPSAVGGGVIMDLFFLHDRGKAFITFEVAVLLGATSGPTFGGFILNEQSWTVCFWWTVPLLALAASMVFLFCEETGYERHGENGSRKKRRSYLSDRSATFLPGNAVIDKRPTIQTFVRETLVPFYIGLSPATVVTGLFTLVIFGWHLMNDILSPIFLQLPVAENGYGFTPAQNGAFTFSIWIGLVAAEVLGFCVNDTVPLWICRRYYGGVWSPEYRLYCLVITLVLEPMGLGICGAGLEYRLHYMVFALGVFIVATGALYSVPIAANYVAESYVSYGTACTLVTTLYRLGWGVAIPFFINQWIAAVGIGWVYGISAFITLASGLLIALLLSKGDVLRKYTLMRDLASSESGTRLWGGVSEPVQ